MEGGFICGEVGKWDVLKRYFSGLRFLDIFSADQASYLGCKERCFFVAGHWQFIVFL